MMRSLGHVNETSAGAHAPLLRRAPPVVQSTMVWIQVGESVVREFDMSELTTILATPPGSMSVPERAQIRVDTGEVLAECSRSGARLGWSVTPRGLAAVGTKAAPAGRPVSFK